MKKFKAVAVLLLVVSMPLLAAPRDDDSPRQTNPIARIVHFIAHMLDELMVPRP